jgi:hypothetical protein
MLNSIQDIYLLASARSNNLSEPLDIYLKIVNELEAANNPNNISRAKFITEQINGNRGKEIFDANREEWGINNFEEDILAVDDFKRGFLWCFRDHTTSWRDNQKAKTWFLNSIEAIFIRRYEFWTCDNGFDECIDVREGSYKEILLSLLKDGDYEVLSSPVFTKEELNDFVKKYNPQSGDFTIEGIIEDYIESNPNY